MNNEVNNHYNEDFLAAVQSGDSERLQALLNARRADPATYDSGLETAAKNGQSEIVRALLRDGLANPGAKGSLALRWAAENGYTEIVLALLSDPRTDPADALSEALWIAARNGHTQVVLALLQDGRAKPTDRSGGTLNWGVANGHTDIVRALLKDGRAPVAVSFPSLRRAARGGHVDVLCLALAAMGAAAHRHVEDLRPSHIAASARMFLNAYENDPLMPRVLHLVHALVKTDLATKSIFALAYEAARRNMDPQTVLALHTQGLLTSLLHNTLGPNAEMPAISAIEAAVDLPALASASKAEPVLQAGQMQLDLAQYPNIIAALAPSLPAHVANAMWQTLRAQARGEERQRAYGTPAERVRDRMASSVLLTAAVKEYYALGEDTKKVSQDKQPLLSAAAKRFAKALNVLRNAVQSKNLASITKAQGELHSSMDTYQERAATMLPNDAQRARRFHLIRSIVRMPAEQVADLAQAQKHQGISRSAHLLDL